MKKILAIASGAIMSSVILTGSTSAEEIKPKAANSASGKLTLVANGEDFVRQGFIAKDGWQIDFDRVYVNVSQVSAYQVPGSFDAETTADLTSLSEKPQVTLVDTPQTVDLAAGDADADPISISESEAIAGLYNALFWKVATADKNSPISGQTMVLQGKATKEGRTVDFDLKLNQPTAYLCGEFVGDERKGIVKQADSGEVEITFHFDHLFGDGERPPEDELNQKALGFQPLVDLTTEDRLQLDEDVLASELSPENYQKLTKAIAGLGHVGEGHCAISD